MQYKEFNVINSLNWMQCSEHKVINPNYIIQCNEVNMVYSIDKYNMIN